MDTYSRISYLYLDGDGNLVAQHTAIDARGQRHTSRTVIHADADAIAGRDRDGNSYRVAPPARQRPSDGRGGR